MNPTSVITLFCEDIREEKSGQFTLVGILPDNFNAEVAAPVPDGNSPIIPKLCIYSRLHFDPTHDIGPITATLVFPDDTERKIDLFDPETVAKARQQALDQGGPIVGLIARMQIVNFPIISEGRIRVVVTIGGQQYISGALNLRIVGGAQDKKVSPSASEPTPPF